MERLGKGAWKGLGRGSGVHLTPPPVTWKHMRGEVFMWKQKRGAGGHVDPHEEGGLNVHLPGEGVVVFLW